LHVPEAISASLDYKANGDILHIMEANTKESFW